MGVPLLNHQPHKLFLLLPILLLSTFFQLQTTLIEGRALKIVKEEGKEKMIARALMGSRPPSCEKRCTSCGHCEAVQMPVVPFTVTDFLRPSSSGVDFSSNYKPMNWKCKCGNMIFNP